MLLLPAVGQVIQCDSQEFGVWVGSSLQSTAQVVTSASYFLRPLLILPCSQVLENPVDAADGHFSLGLRQSHVERCRTTVALSALVH